MNPNILNETDEERRKRVDETLRQMRANQVGFSRDTARIQEGLYAQGRTPEQMRERMMTEQLQARQQEIETEATATTEQERIKQLGLMGKTKIEGELDVEQERVQQEGMAEIERNKPRPFQILSEGSLALDPANREIVATNPRTDPAMTNVATPVVDEQGNQVPGKFILNGKTITVQQGGGDPFGFGTPPGQPPGNQPPGQKEMPKRVRVRRPDGTIGFIPAENADAAISQGYTIL